ncbi:hypothetical protein [Actinoplanes sp. CA-252034]|uniref:hypothetical protein n=1 Tax=Actinoplanes sp. CA-252034 TaxID=3239906 RepID=UPI003D9670BB
MLINRLRAAFLSTMAATAVVAGTSTPAFADPGLDVPLVVSAELLSTAGDGCSQPAIHLGDNWLDVQAQAGGDASLLLNAYPAVGQRSVAIECELRVRLQLDQLAELKPAQYLMSGWLTTAAGTKASRYFESSFDGTDWYGQRTSHSAGATGPFYQGGGSRFDPRSACSTEIDLSFRVGLSLTSTDGLAVGDAIGLDGTSGAGVELNTTVGACA